VGVQVVLAVAVVVLEVTAMLQDSLYQLGLIQSQSVLVEQLVLLFIQEEQAEQILFLVRLHLLVVVLVERMGLFRVYTVSQEDQAVVLVHLEILPQQVVVVLVIHLQHLLHRVIPVVTVWLVLHIEEAVEEEWEVLEPMLRAVLTVVLLQISLE
jgi:hypothetical protein